MNVITVIDTAAEVTPGALSVVGTVDLSTDNGQIDTATLFMMNTGDAPLNAFQI